MKKIFLSLLLCFFSQLCFSQTQSEMTQQAQIAYEKADAKMTKIYKGVMAGLELKNDKNLLLEAQRAWIKYKETHCKAIAHQFEGGSMQPMVYYSCLEELTNDRIKQLNEYMKN